MNVTYENFIELQPGTVGANTNQRLWNFLLVSVLLHLIIFEVLLEHYSPMSVSPPLPVIPDLSITINHTLAAVPVRTISPAAIPVDKTNKINHRKKINKQSPTRANPVVVPPSPVVVLPISPEQKVLPKAKVLIQKGLDNAAKTGKRMEARVNPDIFMTQTIRDKLIMAMTMQEQEDPNIDNPPQLQVYTNQYGDLVYQTGNSCVAIPAVLVPFTFKQINSIIATPISCGNGKQESTFSLK